MICGPLPFRLFRISRPLRRSRPDPDSHGAGRDARHRLVLTGAGKAAGLRQGKAMAEVAGSGRPPRPERGLFFFGKFAHRLLCSRPAHSHPFPSAEVRNGTVLLTLFPCFRSTSAPWCPRFLYCTSSVYACLCALDLCRSISFETPRFSMLRHAVRHHAWRPQCLRPGWAGALQDARHEVCFRKTEKDMYTTINFWIMWIYVPLFLIGLCLCLHFGYFTLPNFLALVFSTTLWQPFVAQFYPTQYPPCDQYFAIVFGLSVLFMMAIYFYVIRRKSPFKEFLCVTLFAATVYIPFDLITGYYLVF